MKTLRTLKKLIIILTMFTIITCTSTSALATTENSSSCASGRVKNFIKVFQEENIVADGHFMVSGCIVEQKYFSIALRVRKTDSKYEEWFPINSGKTFNKEVFLFGGPGTYIVTIMGNTRDYIFDACGPSFHVINLKEVKRIYPSKDVESNNPQIIQLSREITKSCTTDIDKSKKIFEWVVSNIQYDWDKYEIMKTHSLDFKSGSLEALETKSGVCYDISCLYAALGRAAGLEIKVICGTNRENFLLGEGHAWNMFLYSDRSILIDATHNLFDPSESENVYYKKYIISEEF